MKLIKIFGLILMVGILAQSCREDNEVETPFPPIIEPEIIVKSSVMGLIVDDNGQAVDGASVLLNEDLVFTDANGVFQFKGKSMVSNGTYIEVRKEGYFNGSRRFYPQKDKTSRVKVQLMPLAKVGQFHSSDLGVVSYEGVELEFPPNSVSRLDGTPYLGNVNVAIQNLDPNLTSTLERMPGDLTGVSGMIDERFVLTNWAMVAVELFDDSQNKLQVTEGKLVQLEFPISASLLSNAPSSIDLWHFDEERKIWIHEGDAFISDDKYVAEVGHFSFWNCSMSSRFVQLSGALINRGVALEGLRVKVTELNGGASASTLTGVEGDFNGYVPRSTDLKLEVFNVCNELLYSVDIPSSESEINLGTVNIFYELNNSNLTGSLKLCSGSPSVDSYILIASGSLWQAIAIQDDYTFNSNIIYCDEADEIRIKAIDPINAMESGILNVVYSENINIGEIELCDSDDVLVDSRDGEKYLTTEINGVIWTAQNMRYDTDDALGFDAVFAQQPEHYGRFYSYESALEACPIGWRLPTNDDFSALQDFINADVNLTTNDLKSVVDWDLFMDETNSLGFNGFPVGVAVNGVLDEATVGNRTQFWSATKGEPAVDQNRTMVLDANYDLFLYLNLINDPNAYSVRCIKN